jgi:hypothetical protein
MMTPLTTVRPFKFEIIDLSNSFVLVEFPERFVRCDLSGVPDADHLYEVVETLVEARGFETTLRMALVPTECDTYYPQVVQFGAINGWVRATGGASSAEGR